LTAFWKKRDDLERDLRAARPRPTGYRRSLRFAVPIALTVAMVSALAAVGGMSYAASSVASAAKTVAKVFVPAKRTQPIVVSGLTAGGDQYKGDDEWGSPNHNHEGGPRITHRKKKAKHGVFLPPLTANVVGKTGKISTSFTIDEQADLTISVIELRTGKQLLITQNKSKLGNGVKGPQTKNLRYRVLLPRTIPISLAIPVNLLLPGYNYAIRINARDPDGNKSTAAIPFTG
jgi:hypothetical protein